MDKTAYVKGKAESTEKQFAEVQKSVVSTLEDMLRYAKEGNMDYILFNLGNLSGNAARAYRVKGQKETYEEVVIIMEYREPADETKS